MSNHTNLKVGYSPNVPEIIINENRGPTLGEISVFVTAVMISIGAFFSIILTNLRKSNCSEVECCGCRLKRENLHLETPNTTV